MPIVYTPNPANPLPATVNLPEDDVDDEAAGSVDVPLEALLDAVARLEFQDTPWMPVALDYPTNKDIFGTDWVYGGVGVWVQVQNVAPLPILWTLQLPPRGKLLAVDVRFGGNLGGGGPHPAFPGGQPGTMPSYSLLSYKDGASTSLAAAVDASATAAAYDAAHWLGTVTLAGGGHTIASDEQIALAFNGEAGAAALASALGVCGARVKIIGT